jgi:osmotically-inducible protein OsmY
MISDAQLKQDVTTELKWSVEIEEAKIGVAVSDGAITLSGHVPTYLQKLAAKQAVKRVAGVTAIVDHIDVVLESLHRTTDEGLAERIANVLRWNVSVPGPGIRAEVKNGIVTLTGEVEWQYQRASIVVNIAHVGGVINVVNLITLKPRAHSSDIRHRISDALKRHADVEADKVSVAVVGGTVTLSGSVDSLEQMDRVEYAVWAAPGVTNVVDNLRVGG